MSEEVKRGRGRPKRELNEDQVYKLAQYGLTYKEIADFFECNVSTLLANYQDIISAGAVDLKISLKRAQLESALVQKNITMQIFLGKVLLGQRDYTPPNQTNQQSDLEKMTDEELKQKQKELVKDYIKQYGVPDGCS